MLTHHPSGIAGFLLLLLILLLLRNYRLSTIQNRTFDSNFDLFYTSRNPNLTLDDPEGNEAGRLGIISPFPHAASDASIAHPQMQQYYPPDGPTISSSSSGSGSGHSASHYANVPPVDPHFVHQGAQYPNVKQSQAGVGRGPSQSSSHESHATRASTASGSGLAIEHGNGNRTVPMGRRMSAKERETLSTRPLSWNGRPRAVPLSLGVVNADAGGSSSDVAVPVGAVQSGIVDQEAYLSNELGLIVHQDAGRVEEGVEGGVEERVREEIPPTYDSLPFGERR